MQPPPLPANEAERLASLYALRILDTPAEERYDRITRLAQTLFSVPVALISLVDAERQWFKSRQGISMLEGPRALSFCGHAILESAPLIVEDATRDVRFADNPYVTGDLGVRFYAGCPLSAVDGSRVGTLCIIDRQPRRLEADQQQVLKDLASLVEDAFTLVRIGELHREADARRAAETALTEAENRFHVIFSGVPAGIALVDARRRIIESNPALSRMLGYSPDELKGMQLSELNAAAVDRAEAQQFSELIAGRLEQFELRKRFLRADDSEFDGALTVAAVRNALGEPHHMVAILQPG